ncbi:IS110 family RNA-guided transposase [Nonomuraea wenchangensis]|uniref:Transposase IS116/IS110/IS902 family protein n=1 Tax=Nonomuraea wenchangensis TaxID=568860 RepID=A0A1I0LPU1_9ACTN|nr:IS110 family transposase [Nonomuraea wenchangensis]SEU43095.1 Transposase IS116/IS110/IS902 family protein [Nonomuraea wenchangensis]
MTVTCGIDWSERHHDVALVDEGGKLVAKRRISDDARGWRVLVELLAEHGDRPDSPIPVAIETGRGLLVSCLRATGRKVYAINPLAVARYRERHTVARAKSDHADAMTLANILRVDAACHRPLPQDSELVQAIAVLARAQQDAIWSRQQLSNQLRSLLREYFPAALTAFHVKNIGLTSREARTILQAAPTPTAAAKLTTRRLHALLRASGRQRNIATWADRLQALFSEEHLRQLPLVEEALGRQAQALLLQLDAACRAADDLADATNEAFHQHPDAAVITSFPGLADVTGARVLAELGDDRTRFADARALKAYAGAAPITRASGKSLVVHHRKVKNQRLAAAGYVWAFASLRAPGPRAHYDRRRAEGERHSSALRNTFNRLLGCLHHCLQKGVTYNEDVAFQPPSKAMA